MPLPAWSTLRPVVLGASVRPCLGADRVGQRHWTLKNSSGRGCSCVRRPLVTGTRCWPAWAWEREAGVDMGLAGPLCPESGHKDGPCDAVQAHARVGLILASATPFFPPLPGKSGRDH